MVFFAVGRYNMFFGGVQRRVRQIYRVSTHIGYLTILIQLLRYRHGTRYRKTQLATGFLLQSRCGKRCGRATLCRLCFQTFYSESSVDTIRQKLFSIFLLAKTLGQLSFKGFFTLTKNSDDTESSFRIKFIDFTLTVNNQSYRYRLYTTSWKRWLNFFPQNRG